MKQAQYNVTGGIYGTIMKRVSFFWEYLKINKYGKCMEITSPEVFCPADPRTNNNYMKERFKSS